MVCHAYLVDVWTRPRTAVRSSAGSFAPGCRRPCPANTWLCLPAKAALYTALGFQPQHASMSQGIGNRLNPS